MKIAQNTFKKHHRNDILTLEGKFRALQQKASHHKRDLNGSEPLLMQREPSLNQTCLNMSLFQAACTGHPITNLCPRALQSNDVHIPT